MDTITATTKDRNDGITSDFESVDGKQECGKLQHHDVSKTGTTDLKQILQPSFLRDAKNAAKIGLAAGLSLASINPLIRVLRKKTTTDAEKDQVANKLFENISEIATADVLEKINTALKRSENHESVAGNANDESKIPEKCQVDRCLAEAEVADPDFQFALKQCPHTSYDQQAGRFTWHIVEQVNYNRHYTTIRTPKSSQNMAEKPAVRITVRNDFSAESVSSTKSNSVMRHQVLNCKKLEEMRTCMQRKGFLDKGYGLIEGDTIKKTTKSVNTLYAKSLFKVAQCVYSEIRQKVNPNEFDFLSVKIRVLHGYPATRMLNIKSVSNERGDCFFESNILDNTEDCLVDRKTGVGNIIEVVFTDLQSLTDFTENKQSYDALEKEGKIKIEALSFCPSNKPLMNAELLVLKLKEIFCENQERFKGKLGINAFAPNIPLSETNPLTRHNFLSTYKTRNQAHVDDPDRKIEIQNFWVKNGCLEEHPPHKIPKIE